MRNLISLFFVLFIATFIYSCNKCEEYKEDICPSPEILHFTSKGGDGCMTAKKGFYVNRYTEYKNDTVVSDSAFDYLRQDQILEKDWFTIQILDEYHLYVKVQENKSRKKRSVELILSGGGYSWGVFTVEQEP